MISYRFRASVIFTADQSIPTSLLMGIKPRKRYFTLLSHLNGVYIASCSLGFHHYEGAF